MSQRKKPSARKPRPLLSGQEVIKAAIDPCGGVKIEAAIDPTGGVKAVKTIGSKKASPFKASL